MSKPTIIVWVSRHLPTKRQLAALRTLYPSHLLRVDTRAFSTADDIISRYKLLRGDEMVVVAPWTVIRVLIRRGIHPLYAVMEEVKCSDPKAEVRDRFKNGRLRRCYKFIEFRRVRDVRVELEEIRPTPAGSTVHAPGCDCGHCKLGFTKSGGSVPQGRVADTLPPRASQKPGSDVYIRRKPQPLTQSLVGTKEK